MPIPEASALSRDEFQTLTNVSRETMARLDIYRAMLEKWQPKNGVLECPMANQWATIQFIICLPTRHITGHLNIQKEAVFGIKELISHL